MLSSAEDIRVEKTQIMTDVINGKEELTFDFVKTKNN